MPPPALDIEDAIAFAPEYVNDVGLDNTKVLGSVFSGWVQGMFAANGGIFTNTNNASQRTVIDWRALSQVVANQIDNAALVSPLFDVTNVSDVVYRTLSAVKFAQQRGDITQPQEDDVVALFNAQWA